jgi:hypothetical protein
MSAETPDSLRAVGLGSMLVPTIAVIGEILANSYIIWFLLIDYPSKCARLAAETAGRQSCGLEIGGYVIASASAILILAGIYYLAKWNLPQEEE